jgi:aldose 1-epimerase
MLSLSSPDGRVHVAVDNQCGARLASLRIDGLDIIVSDGADALGWGCYPMVPYAGRVRDGVVHIGGSAHLMPVIAPPHGLHGTVFATPWTVLAHSDARAVLLTELDTPWPVEGTVRHEIAVDDDGLTLKLEVTAHDDMPCQLGWHPWFVRPDAYTVPFRTLWPRDATGITTHTATVHDPDNPLFGTYDDCLSDPVAQPTLTYRTPSGATSTDDPLVLTLDSDCSHWVVFDQLDHGICLEPQSGPPNQINDDPFWLGFGESLTRMFRIGWGNTRR